ncbi:DNA-directed RNA polymerase subunit beta' [Candidatus Saccharibacteria bacterium RIFCSPHIGHO2_12_FULL_41_12]|nr:MAG: DNA-directed RNA polymerase subunit beta' [Candidatus Saccharibacteria bacterium RIFCSPHIGHO2_12_FULL_41_12]
MRRYASGVNIADFDAVQLAIASPEDIKEWSHGEVTKPETINYRTQKPERDGLFCERIFGPVKDINPHDAKYKGIRSREAAIDKNGELVTRSIVRRERMAHIALAVPVAHIWFLRGTPSAIGLVLGMTVKNLERIAYFASYVVKSVDTEKRDQILLEKQAEFEAATAAIKMRYEEEAKSKDANVKELAAKQTEELEELESDFLTFKDQVLVLNKYGLISENDYRELPDNLQKVVNVDMGGKAIKDLLEEIDLNQLIEELNKEADESKGQRKKKLLKRLRLLENMKKSGIKPSSMCLSAIPVIPPDLRPMVQLTGGRFATSDLNDLYRRVINRNNRLKKLVGLNAPEVIQRNEQRMLQEAVDALIDNGSSRTGKAVAATSQKRRLKSLSDMLKGKQGRFRQNLLGKRVDYSGRSVIVSGPELTMEQCGLPKMMALELFKPFVIGRLIELDYAHNIRSATRMIETSETAVWDALDHVIRGKYVLLNRAPSLHRLSIQAFQPVLIEGKAIQLNPLVCKGFNADFDGDQMAVHLPLSDDAQAEARDIMAASKNLLKPADGSPILHIEQDIVLGCYYLTYRPPGASETVKHYTSMNEATMVLESGKLTLQDLISVEFRGQKRTSTLGRFMFNEIFPEDFPYVDEAMTKKKLSATMARAYSQYGQDVSAKIADKLKELGFKSATNSGLSMGMSDFINVKNLDTILGGAEEKAAAVSEQFAQGFITEEERFRLTIETWTQADEAVQVALTKQFATENSAMSLAVTSGARGSIVQVKQVIGSVGILSDATGKAMELPVRSNYRDGLDPLEYFISARGARKGLIDTALKTADSGYLTRRLVDVAQDVFSIEEDSQDPGFSMLRSDAAEIGVSYASRLSGRYAAENLAKYVKKGALITEEMAAAIEEDASINGVKIMSVLSCNALHGVNPKSYGTDPSTGQLVALNSPIGVIAAQSIGEPGTQLTLRTFHSGGAAAADDITQGLPRVEEIFEVRVPKGKAFLSDIAGKANVWEEGDNYIVQVTDDKAEPVELIIGDRVVSVAEGTVVSVGDVLATDETGENPLIASVAGKVHLTKKKIKVVPVGQSVIKYVVPGYKQVLVGDGEMVVAGQRLTNGSINAHDLMRLQGVEPTQRYIMNEILRIFVSQGQNISDKHLEIIVRQMFSRVQIDDAGDSDFVTGDIVSKLAVASTNKELVLAGKEPAVYNQLLLGITKASLSTDSFLSAASFQDTTRVLIGAATSGKVDKLFGLKENVILGRKIPVGTGARVDEPDIDSEEEEEQQ